MTVTVATKNEDQLTEPAQRQVVCHHHWTIEEAEGPVSNGICSLCGARRQFFNYLSDCLRATEEEYETWLARQKDYSKLSRLVGKTPVGV